MVSELFNRLAPFRDGSAFLQRDPNSKVIKPTYLYASNRRGRERVRLQTDVFFRYRVIVACGLSTGCNPYSFDKGIGISVTETPDLDS